MNIVNIHLNVIASILLHAGEAINLGLSFKLDIGQLSEPGSARTPSGDIIKPVS